MVTIGIVGAGFMAGTHADRYAAIPDADVAAVAAPNTAPSFVAERGLDAAVYDDPVAMFDRTGLDAVDVCTPTPTHRALVTAAAERGLDVFCEKPLARTVAGAEAVAAAVEEAGVTAMVGHVVRFFPEYAAMRRQAVEGEVGVPGLARARRLSPFPDWGRDDWYADEARSGGVFLDLSIHDFDYLRWLFGEVERVFARRRSWDGRQHGHATLRFADGAVGYVEGSTAQPPERGFRTELEIAGGAGLLEYDSADPEPLAVATGADREGIGNLPENPLRRDGFHRELAAFVESVASGAEPPVTIADAAAAVRVAVAANRSAERGVPVAPAEVGP
jgi:predicted dehydrogenase